MADPKKTELMRIVKADFPTFAKNCLLVMPKEGGRPRPFILNRAQLYVHGRLEEQRAKNHGRVRALILKGRQQGISTLLAGRFYWRSSTSTGVRAYIIAHEQGASDNLFNMVKRYHENNPLAPRTGASNAKELQFIKLDGGYKVATAGAREVGRSATAQLLHASEVPMWPNAEHHIAGIGQIVPDIPDTEIVFESTAKGVGNWFHQQWQMAEEGATEYIPIFVPWLWQEEYTKPVPKDFALTQEEQEYVRAFGATLGQMVWRRDKAAAFGRGFEYLFDQEYPACAALAFQGSTSDPFIRADYVHAAANNEYRQDTATAPLIIGVDPAEFGPDRTVICYRRGRVAPKFEVYSGKDTMETAGIVARRIAEMKPEAVFVDAVGIGAGVRDRLQELGFAMVHGVKSGMRAADDDTYANKRAEMWGRMREWLLDAPCRIPNDPALIADLSAPAFRYDSSGRLLIEKKDDMKKRGIRSPDMADALALTFAEAVAPKMHIQDEELGYWTGSLAAGGYAPALDSGY